MKFILFIITVLPCFLFGTTSEKSAGQETPVMEEVIGFEDETTFEEHVMSLRSPEVKIDLRQVYSQSPIIYSLLLTLSMTAVFLWLYTVLRWRTYCRYGQVKGRLAHLLQNGKYNEAVLYCQARRDLLSKMVVAGLQSRQKSPMDLEALLNEVVTEASSASWQRISILNDIAIIAPMLGLMGTVLGMFYAFYDINRSLNSITKLFDGLGISVATTVAGLVVAILAFLLHTYLKHRLIRRLAVLEREAKAFLPLLVRQEEV